MRLLLVSCSKRKRYFGNEPRPALEVYDGPTFRLIRRFFKENPQTQHHMDVLVLSAKYGLISSNQPITDYDLVMTHERALTLKTQVIPTLYNALARGYSEICIHLGSAYSLAIMGWENGNSNGSSVKTIEGTQGVKLQRLKAWLYGYDVSNEKQKPRAMIKPRGKAIIHGVEISLSPEQILDVALKEMSKEMKTASSYVRWYVPIGNERISPKWLISKLSGLPVSAFTSGEARRALSGLGIATFEVDKKTD